MANDVIVKKMNGWNKRK